MNNLYIGLMSGTSADGIDAILVNFQQSSPEIIATHYTPYSNELRKKILSLCHHGENEIQRLGELDVQLGKEFATAVHHLLTHADVSANAIKAIGSHGQTIRHLPRGLYPFTLQIGDPNIIAAETGITTIADFRRKDIAFGGQGAPLVPAFHQFLFMFDHQKRAIINIGGIANVTILTQNQPVLGFDIGPGNILFDAWVYRHLQKNCDEKGEWGAQGVVQTKLLNQLLNDDFFKLLPPKTTGREYFNLAWLNHHLHCFDKTFSPVDVQATLVELTARSILDAVSHYFSNGEILICGGGVHNLYLMSRLQTLAESRYSIASTEKYDLHPDWIEALAFAWLAKQTLNREVGNLPSVTGATQNTILGGIYYV